ncbi:MAG: hypothetical protein AAF318_17220 [Pseudomonadota bacterium]
MHVHPEAWMPNQQNLHDTDVKENGTVVMNARPVQADGEMCVTQAIFDAGMTHIDDMTDPDKIADFDKDGDDKTFTLTEYDETLACGELGTALNAGEPWIGFCDNPDCLFSLYDIVMLEEPPHDPDTLTIVQPNDDPAWLEKTQASTFTTPRRWSAVAPTSVCATPH